jgi:nicotinate-nucleotide adenylyltransferase
MQKLAIFGGTFNPIHWGHLLIAETALDQVSLDRILWVPAYRPPHKQSRDMLLSYDHRLEMVRQAVADHPQFAVSSVEKEQPGHSYAIDTLRTLQQLYSRPNVAVQWYWIVGLDAFQALPHWYGYRELATRCTWLVAPRPRPATATQAEEEKSSCEVVAQGLAAQSIEIQWQMLQMPIMAISSSLIRAYCRQGRSIRYLVPESARHYILTHGLYQSSNG